MKTLKHNIFLIVILVILINCRSQNQPLTCKDFKNGTFEFYDNELNKKYVIIRKNDSQIEKIYDLTTNKLESNASRIIKIKWLNACEYEAMLDTAKSKYDDIDLQMISAGGLNNKIIKIEKNCAKIEVSIGNFKKDFEICKKQ